MYKLTALQKFILEAIRAHSDKEFVRAVNRLSKQKDVDWNEAIGPGFKVFLPIYLEAKRIAPQFNIPEEIDEIIKVKYLENVAKNEEYKKVILQIANEFNAARINYVFIKGAALIFSLYKYDIGERVMGDIDVLVQEERIHDAEKILINLGYRELKEAHPFHSQFIKSNIEVEIHWNVSGQQNKSLPLEILKLSYVAEEEDTKIMFPTPQNNFFLLCHNFSQDLDHFCKYISSSQRHTSTQLTSKIVNFTLEFFYESKRILEYYENRIDLESLINLVELSKRRYGIKTALYLLRNTARINLPKSLIRGIKTRFGFCLFAFFAQIYKNDLAKILLMREKIPMLRQKARL